MGEVVCSREALSHPGGWGTFPGPACLLHGNLRWSKERNSDCGAQACLSELLQLEMFIIAAMRTLPQTHSPSWKELK